MVGKHKQLGRIYTHLLFLPAVLILQSCGGGGGSGVAASPQVSGRVTAPSAGTDESASTALANAQVFLEDFLAAATARETFVGETDQNGNYSVDAPAGISAIVVRGTINDNSVRISGLVQTDTAALSKELNTTTDIAAEALIGAVNDGEASPGTSSQTTITNLEEAAAQYLQDNSVDFFDPQSVSAAASRVRIQTNNGANSIFAASPTPAPTPAPPSDGCRFGETTCADGFPICAELVCNGTIDCADGSDEDDVTCGDEAACCLATNSCPGETATLCSEQCCCCTRGLVCDQANPANGCVEAPEPTSRGRYPELEKVIGQAIYY